MSSTKQFRQYPPPQKKKKKNKQNITKQHTHKKNSPSDASDALEQSEGRGRWIQKAQRELQGQASDPSSGSSTERSERSSWAAWVQKRGTNRSNRETKTTRDQGFWEDVVCFPYYFYIFLGTVLWHTIAIREDLLVVWWYFKTYLKKATESIPQQQRADFD